MKYFKTGFTLIELLIAVTISALLMVSVMVFTGNMMSSVSKNQKMLTAYNENTDFDSDIIETIKNTNVDGLLYSGTTFGGYNTGIFLSTKSPNLPFTYIGLKSFTGYCDSYSGSASATGTVQKLVIKGFYGINSHSGTSNYYIDSNSNTIRKSDKSIFIGTGYKGNTLDASGLITELNNPSAIIETGGYLYIADRGNNRILSYSGITGIEEIASQKDGINNPTDIYYSGGLYIANSGNGNILKIYNQNGNTSTFSGVFRLPKDITIDKITFSFSGITSITSPTSSGSFSFSGFSKGLEDTINTGSELSYYFSGTTINFNSGTVYGIGISNIAPNPSFSGTFVKINFLSGSDLKESINLPYYSFGKSIDIMSGGIDYPNNIVSDSSWDSEITDWSGNLNNADSEEIVSNLPVESFYYYLSGDILTIRIFYYKYYDCINEKHIVKEKIYKKYLH